MKKRAPSRWLSLGGWCGPSLALSKLGLRNPSETPSPFDFVRCSLDAITHFTRTADFSDFFSTGEISSQEQMDGHIPVDPVSIWLLQRCVHTCFAHFDVNQKMVREEYSRRFRSYQKLLREGPSSNLIFVRSIISCDILDEVRESLVLEQCLREIGAFRVHESIRIVLIAHDQRLSSDTQRIFFSPQSTLTLPEHIHLWSLEYDTLPVDEGLFARTHRSYEKILNCTSEDTWGKVRRCIALDELRHTQNLSHVEGVPIFLYSNTGFGTTRRTSHASLVYTPTPAMWDTGRDWTQDEDNYLTILLKRELESGADHVDMIRLVEEAANTLNRAANETLTRLRVITEKE